jgi:fructose-1,6-bisphosphatase
VDILFQCKNLFFITKSGSSGSQRTLFKRCPLARIIEGCGGEALLKVSKSQKQILKFSFEPKANKNIIVYLP